MNHLIGDGTPGAAARFDGRSWHYVGANHSQFYSVLSCASATFCVGSNGYYAAAFTGHGWTAGFSGSPADFSCPTTSFCAFGNYDGWAYTVRPSA